MGSRITCKHAIAFLILLLFAAPDTHAAFYVRSAPTNDSTVKFHRHPRSLKEARAKKEYNALHHPRKTPEEKRAIKTDKHVLMAHSPLSIFSMVCGVLSGAFIFTGLIMLTGNPITAPAVIVIISAGLLAGLAACLGYLGLRKKQSAGMARAGIIVGSVVLFLALLMAPAL